LRTVHGLMLSRPGPLSRLNRRLVPKRENAIRSIVMKIQ
jgi:hypothetical protein